MGTRLYIGRLSHHARENDVERFFKGYGRIKELLLKNGYGFVEFDDSRDADDAVCELNGKELCGDRVIVQHAHATPRGDDYRRGGGGGGGYRDNYGYPPRGGRRGYGGGGYGGGGGGGGRDRFSNNYRYDPPTRTEHRIVVKNLSSRCMWQDLKDYMRQAGEVTYAVAHKERQNEGIVEFATRADVKNALKKLDGTEINGRKIKLVEEGSSGSGSRRGRSRSRSASRSRSRSRSRHTRSRSKSGSRSRSRSPSKGRSRSKSKEKVSRTRSKSGEDRERSKSHSKSRSKSPADRASPEANDQNDSRDEDN